MNRRSTIEFDRKIELDWLDATAAKVAAGATEQELHDFLFAYLDFLSIEGRDTWGTARAKTARVLTRIWSRVPAEAEPLRDRAIRLLPQVQPGQRLALHWAMMIAAYPFFADIAAALGRLLSLQETVSSAQLQRRIAERWGDRSTVYRTLRHVVRSIVAWGVLEDAGKGVYRRSGQKLRPVGGQVAQLLVEAVLLDSEQDSLPLDQASNHPALFPFHVEVNVQQLRQPERIRVYRQGLDMDVVAIAL